MLINYFRVNDTHLHTMQQYYRCKPIKSYTTLNLSQWYKLYRYPQEMEKIQNNGKKQHDQERGIYEKDYKHCKNTNDDNINKNTNI